MATKQEIDLFRDLVSKGIDANRAKEVITKARGGQTSSSPTQTQPTSQTQEQDLSIFKDTPEQTGQLPTGPRSIEGKSTLDILKPLGKTEKIEDTTPEFKQEQGFEGFVGETKEALGERGENLQDINQRLQNKITEGQTKIKEEIEKGNKEGLIQAAKNQLNIFGSSFQTAGQLVGGAADVIWEGLENTIQELTPEQVEDVVEGTLGAIGNTDTAQSIAESYADFRERKPELARNIEAAVNISQIIPAGNVARKGGQETLKSTALREVAQGKVEQYIKPTKITTKQQVKQIGPELINKLKTGELKTGERDFLQKQAQEQVSRLGKEIDTFIKNGNVKGEIELNSLVGALAEADNALRIDGVLLPGNEAASRFINKQVDFLSNLETKYGKTLPAEKQVELRRLYDVVFDKAVTRDKITKFQDDLQVKLADNLRKELAKNNPTLANLNKDFSFYKTLDNVLDETSLRTVGQDEVGLINTIRQASQGTAGSAIGAAAGGSVGGIPGATIGAVVGGATGAKLSTIINSPKYKLVSAKKKSQLADAIASGDTTAIEKAVNSIILSQNIDTEE